jgi:DNA-binding GntR family transcriptional regulator
VSVQEGGKSKEKAEFVGRDAGKASTLIGKTHAQLKNNIITGFHRPGEKLRVEHLKRDYGVSGGTLREALTMLIADRLVIGEGQRGFRVKPVSVKDLIDLNRIRIVLEKEAIRQSIAHGDDEWEGRVVSSFHLLIRSGKGLFGNFGDPDLFDEWGGRHHAFHVALFSAAPSEWSRYFLTIAYQQFERYRQMFHVMAQGIARPRDVEAEHIEILEAVLARNADAASTLLEQHLLRTLDEWVEFFEKTGALGPDKSLQARCATPRGLRVDQGAEDD